MKAHEFVSGVSVAILVHGPDVKLVVDCRVRRKYGEVCSDTVTAPPLVREMPVKKGA